MENVSVGVGIGGEGSEKHEMNDLSVVTWHHSFQRKLCAVKLLTLPHTHSFTHSLGHYLTHLHTHIPSLTHSPDCRCTPWSQVRSSYWALAFSGHSSVRSHLHSLHLLQIHPPP